MPALPFRNTRNTKGKTDAMGFQRIAFLGLGFGVLLYILTLVAVVVMAIPARADSASSGGQATLTIRIENVSPRGGIIRVGLYSAAQYPDDNCKPTASADVPARAGETIITLPDIPPGTYALETFQDINANGKMDMSFMGLPLEPFGFSRDVHPLLRKPHFSAVSFAVIPGENSQILHLQNSLSLIAAR